MAIITSLGYGFSLLGNLFNSFLFKIFVLIDEPHEKIIANIIIILVFAVFYYIIFLFQKEKTYSVEKVSVFDALYFSFVVHFTLGFGDIFPVSTASRILVIIHTTLFWVINLINQDIVKKVSPANLNLRKLNFTFNQ